MPPDMPRPAASRPIRTRSAQIRPVIICRGAGTRFARLLNLEFPARFWVPGSSAGLTSTTSPTSEHSLTPVFPEAFAWLRRGLEGSRGLSGADGGDLPGAHAPRAVARVGALPQHAAGM